MKLPFDVKKLPIGKKHVEIGKSFLPSAALFGLAGCLALMYYTDWRAVLQYVPIYNSKYEKKK